MADVGSWGVAGLEWPTTSINYGPLTTTFTPSPTCLSYPHVRTRDKGPVFYDGLGGDDGTCFKTGAARPDVVAYNYNTDCYPVPLSASVDKDQFWQLSIGYFSPANKCPHAWTTATTSVESGGETEIACCPSQLALSTRSSGGPICTLTSGMTLTASGRVDCDDNPDMNGKFVSTTVVTGTYATTLGNYGLIHPPIIMRWRDGDESKTTISTGGGTSPTAKPASSQSGTPISTSAPGAGTRIAAGGVLTFVLGGASIVAWLLI